VLNKFKNYFTYNKKERNGILLLSFVLMFLIVFYQFSHFFIKETKTDFSSFEKAISKLNFDEKVIKKDSLFMFNPNTLSDDGWNSLGLSYGKIKVLRNYQKSGGYFKQKEDLKRCFAIGDNFFLKIASFIKLPQMELVKPLVEQEINQIRKQLIELNQADSLELIEIKGIGPFYAKQILKYRNELGGFLNYNQFSEIWGIDKLDLQNFKNQTQIDTLYIGKKNINTITIDELKKHPYLNYKEAKMIVNFRKQHGDFKSVNDIQKIKPISPEKFRKIAPYLKSHD